jgi:hypothetical protein
LEKEQCHLVTGHCQGRSGSAANGAERLKWQRATPERRDCAKHAMPAWLGLLLGQLARVADQI